MAEEPQDPYNLLDSDTQQAINDLTELGRIEKDVTYGGHTFGLRTLTLDEELAVARVIDPWNGNSREHIAYSTAMVAVSITHFDGDPDFCPAIGHNVIDNARGRFQFVSKHWHWPVVEFLYQHIARLSAEQAELIERVENLSGPEAAGSFDVGRALIDSGLFNDATNGADL